MVADKKTVGQRIKLIRQTKGMTLEEFGKIFDASKGNVSLWENGSSLPSNERMRKIASIGNLTVEELIGSNDNRSTVAIGSRIRTIRKKLGLTLEGFGLTIAKELNVSKEEAPSKSNVSKWESGYSLPNNTRLKAIAKIGNVTVNYLLGETDLDYMLNALPDLNADELQKLIEKSVEELKNR